MLGAGLAGSLIGVQAGVLFWLIQRLSGETIEERWAREYAYRLQLLELNISKLKAGDKRADLLGVPPQQALEEMNESVKEKEEKAEEEEEVDLQDWKRTLVMTLREWAIKIGLLTDYSYKGDER